MSTQLLESTLLFRFRAPLRQLSGRWKAKGFRLDESFVLPSFGELAGRPVFADMRGAWNEAGLYFSVSVAGKKQPPWCRESRVEDSDGLHVLIDTRDTKGIHRASRFCHYFALLPAGGGQKFDRAVARMLPIRRARDVPRAVAEKTLKIVARRKRGGYELHAHLPAEALTGFDPAEHGQLGFMFAVIDRELGWQTFNLGPEFPILEDPSLWGTLDLKQASTVAGASK